MRPKIEHFISGSGFVKQAEYRRALEKAYDELDSEFKTVHQRAGKYMRENRELKEALQKFIIIPVYSYLKAMRELKSKDSD